MELSELLSVLILIGIIVNIIITLNKKNYSGIDDIKNIKSELISEIRESRKETVDIVQNSITALSNTLITAVNHSAEVQNERTKENFVSLNNTVKEMNSIIKESQEKQFELQDKRLDEISKSFNIKQDSMLKVVSERMQQVDKSFLMFTEQNKESLDGIRITVKDKLEAIQTDNTKQLDKMRETVDEKLQKTLNERISQSFKMVNDRLQEVYTGLGEMKTLANGVGDLKKVLSNVKTRGIMGELQLGAIIEEILSKEQYDENVITKKSTQNRVEYAIKLPGDGDSCVYLPIDAKFPGDAYYQLVDAYDNADANAIATCGSVLEARIKSFAKDIHDKYIDPPATTDFAIMFLPIESLYAEVVRRGLVDYLQRQYKINVAGPTTFAALLNSLQMGFRTLAIQKRSSEVWNVLGAVKTEFCTFETVLANAQKRIEQTGAELDKLVGVRTRQINKKLRDVAEISYDDAKNVLETTDIDEE